MKRSLIIYGIIYTLIAGVLVALTPFFIALDHGRSLLDPIVLFILSGMVAGGSFFLNSFYLTTFPVRKRIIINIIVYLLLTGLCILIHKPLWDSMTAEFHIEQPFIRDEFLRNALIFSISYLIALFYLYRIKNKEIEHELEFVKQENLTTQVESLKQQMNPHFFFNALNTLSGLIREDSTRSIEFLDSLSQVFRYVLSMQDKNLVYLKEELAFADAFIFMQKIRFEDKFQVTMELDRDDNDQIVSLSLQLLLENAIKHNNMTRSNPLIIRIYRQNDFLVVENNIQPKLKGVESTRIGLRNLETRCRLLVGKSIEITHTDTLFQVKVPLIHSV